MKKYFLISVKFLVSFLLIWVLFDQIDLSIAFDRAKAAKLWPLLFVLLVFVMQIAIGGGRWGFVLNAIGAPLKFFDTVKLFYIGGFFNQVLPSSVGGDAVRIFMSYKRGLSLSKAINGVMIERIVTLAGLAVLCTLVLPGFIPKLDPITKQWVLLIFPTLVFGLVVGIIFLSFLNRLPSSFEKFKIFRGLTYLASDTRSIFFNPKSLSIAIGLGVLTHVCISTYVFGLGVSLDLELTWLDCLILIPPVMLITTMPISIAGWGVRETAMVIAMGTIGVPDDAALVLSILFGFSAIVFTLPAALLWILNRSQAGKVSFDEIERTIKTSSSLGARLHE